ncbi:MAG: hypothetical protein KF853_13880 [Rhodocyclaceae bacterium]|jgi:hypothetical protein|nr:hypothetical protein [Rhodocyclaceae bacterium]MCP5297511.1 hypothetical protein [Zoogloeaceae bacterium]MBX3678102.1 hypothetical protein [Rhodocyclaceae bacterium]MBZ0133047.1 hypothetical protein [Rhodocyclaceae bacterium]MCB1892823.1 hypothetical protein [Rhodocyclaceae bacterium]
MQMDLIMIIGLAAVFVMLINLYQVVSLKSKMSGGLVGKSWNLMILLVVLFAAGYSILPFLATLPVETLRTIVSLILFFGAIYVLITIRLIYGIIKELSS